MGRFDQNPVTFEKIQSIRERVLEIRPKDEKALEFMCFYTIFLAQKHATQSPGNPRNPREAQQKLVKAFKFAVAYFKDEQQVEESPPFREAVVRVIHTFDSTEMTSLMVMLRNEPVMIASLIYKIAAPRISQLILPWRFERN